MKKPTSRKRYNTYSLITLIVIILSFGYYYFFYIPQQESLFHKKGFRIIEKTGENVELQYDNYKEIIKNYLDHLSSEEVDQGKANYELSSELKIDTLKADSEQVINDYKRVLERKTVSDEMRMFISKNDAGDSIFYSFKIKKLFEDKLRYDFFKAYVVFDTQEIYYSDIPVSYSNVLFDSVNKDYAFISSELLNVRFDNEVHQMYLVPVNIGDGYTMYLGGIVDNDFFSQQTHSLNPATVTFILIFLSLFILALPLLKLLLISENERFKTLDAFLGLIAIIIGAAFLTQLLLYNYLNNGPAYEHRENLLKTYADTISENFIEELIDGVELLEACDNELIELAAKKQNKLKSPFSFDRVYEELRYNKSALNEFMITWIDEAGKQVIKWGKGSITPMINVAERNYFKQAADSNLLHLKCDKGSKHSFYLEYIQSWTETSVYAMLSRRSGVDSLVKKYSNQNKKEGSVKEEVVKPHVIAMGLSFNSLDSLNTIGNVSYMLISEDGTVLSHKNKARDLQENIIEECNHDPQLIEALYGRKETCFSAFYNSSNRMFYIKAVDNLPLYFLVYLDHDYEKLSDIQVLFLSSELYVMILLIFLFEVGLFAVINRKRHVKTKGSKLYFEWIWPKPENRNVYISLSALILVSYVIYYLSGLHHNLFHILSIVLVLLTANLVVLRQNMIKKQKNPKGKKQAYVILTVFYIVFVFMAIFLYHWDKSPLSPPFIWFYTILLLSLLLILINSKKFNNAIKPFLHKKIKPFNNKVIKPLHNDIVKPLHNDIIKPIHNKIIKAFHKKKSSGKKSEEDGNMNKKLAKKSIVPGLNNYKTAYAFYLFSIVLALGFFPSVDSFVKAYRLEKEMYQRNCQYSLLRSKAASGDLATDSTCLQVPHYTCDAFNDTLYPIAHITADSTDTLFAIEYIVTEHEKKLISFFRYAVDDNNNNESIMGLLNKPGDTIMYWEKEDSAVILVSTVHNIQISSPKFLQLSSNIWTGNNIRNWIYTILALSLLMVIFKLLHFWSSKVFLLDIDKIELIEVIDAIKRSKFVYIISPTLCKAKDYLKEYKYFQADIDFLQYNTKDKLDTKIKQLTDKYIDSIIDEETEFNLLVIDPYPHDETTYGIKAEAICQLKEKIENPPNRRLIILSTSHPAFYSNIFKDKPEANDVYNNFKAYVNIIGDFLRCYFPVKIYRTMTGEKEDRYGIFKNYHQVSGTVEPDDNDFVETEDFTIQIQIESQNYFYSLWNNLEAREQHLVYDIAQNGLINYKNLPIIYNLMNKGILIRDEHNALVLFSKSFRNFVLSIIDREQALLVETMARRSGNWSNLRFPLIMIFIAAFALLFIAEQDIFNDVIGWLLAASASIPILMRTFMSAGNISKPKPKGGS